MRGSSQNQREVHESISYSVNGLPQVDPLVKPLIHQSQDTSRLFWVSNLETTDHYQINATLLLNSTNCLIYSNLTSITNTTLEDLNHTFELNIYPKLTTFFGSPPDIDNNGQIIILIFDIIDGLSGGQYIAGFFYPLNQHLNKDLHPSQRYSNEAEILHIDKLALEFYDFGTLAHEFQHLIHYGQDEDEDKWLDEGASMFSEYLTGYSIGIHESYFESNPDVSLTFWDYSNTEDLLLANYGASYFFYRFLAEKYGGATIIQNLVRDTSNGTSSVKQVLKITGYNVEFKELFRNWTIANVLPENTSEYSYENITLAMRTEQFDLSSIPRTEDSVAYWGTDYFEFNCSSELPYTFEFQGSSSEFLVTIILTNATPFSIRIIPVTLSLDNLGSFSTDSSGLSADEITVVISAYTKPGVADHNDFHPSPSQTYWYSVNPQVVNVSPGNLTIRDHGESIFIQNITVTDNTGYSWNSADHATFEILTEFGVSTGLIGSLIFNSSLGSWVGSSNISSLGQGNYNIQYRFFNDTSIGIGYSEAFTIAEISILSGNLTLSNKGMSLFIWNVTVIDHQGHFWEIADGAFFEILTEAGDQTGINGSLSFNSIEEYWQSDLTNISSLPEGDYSIKYYFYNKTSNGVFLQGFSIITITSTTSTSTTTTTGVTFTQVTTNTTTSTSQQSSTDSLPTTSALSTDVAATPFISSLWIILTLFVVLKRKKSTERKID